MKPTNKVYRDIFGVDPPAEADEHQDGKHAIGVAKELQATNLRQMAALNIRYAELIEETLAQTGRGSPYMAELHRTCAARKLVEADVVFPPYVIVDL